MVTPPDLLWPHSTPKYRTTGGGGAEGGRISRISSYLYIYNIYIYIYSYTHIYIEQKKNVRTSLPKHIIQTTMYSNRRNSITHIYTYAYTERACTDRATTYTVTAGSHHRLAGPRPRWKYKIRTTSSSRKGTEGRQKFAGSRF